MFKFKKVFLYLLCFISFNSLFLNDVKARPYFSGGTAIFCFSNDYKHYVINNLNQYSDCSSIKYAEYKNETRFAFCASKNAHNYATGKSGYTLDKNWQKDKNCTYYVKNKKWVKKTDGDCSVILGYVLKKALGKTKVSNLDPDKYIMAAFSNWTYLAKFTPSQYHAKNSGPSGGWKNNDKIETIFKKAWKKYYNEYHSKVVDDDADVDDNDMFSVTGGSDLYYVPKRNCGEGSYRSKDFVLTNKKNRQITVTFNTIKGIDVYISNDTGIYTKNSGDKDFEITLLPNEKKNFYLVSSKPSDKTLQFDFEGEYEEKNSKVKIDYYDTDRYKRPSGDDDTQPIIVLKKVEGKSYGVSKKYHCEKSVSVKFRTVKSLTCSGGNSSNEISNNNSNSSNNGSNKSNNNSNKSNNVTSTTTKYYGNNGVVNKVCANKYVSYESNGDDTTKTTNKKGNNGNGNGVNSDNNVVKNKDSYVANFSGCTCVSETIGDKTVRYIVTEKTNFLYGTFAPTYVYPGGGFAFSDSTLKNGVPTQYDTTVNWSYADFVGDDPYYYNGGNPNDYKVDKSTTTTINNELKNPKPVSINVRTINSNSGFVSDTKYVDYSIPFDIGSINIGEKKTITNIKMRNAVFDSNGDVNYPNSNYVLKDTQVSGGNSYYVPLKYMNNSDLKEAQFTFNIVDTNLSSTGYFNFIYNGECSERVINYDLKSNLKYRPISESNPFPKKVADNWVNFDKSRLNNSFGNKKLYSITLNSNAINKINAITSPYTSWKGISSSGVSQFVRDNMTVNSNKNSFCPVGMFDSSCDTKH